MDKVLDRSDDMLIIKGVNVYPSQIETSCSTPEGVGPIPAGAAPQRLHGYAGNQVELIDASLLEEYVKLQTLREHISNRMRSCWHRHRRHAGQSNTIERFQGRPGAGSTSQRRPSSSK
jgi:phenylacetate-CoA ligase